MAFWDKLCLWLNMYIHLEKLNTELSCLQTSSLRVTLLFLFVCVLPLFNVFAAAQLQHCCCDPSLCV